MQNLSTDLELGGWTDFDTRCTNRRVFTQGSAIWELEHSIFYIHSPSKPPKTILGTYNMVSLWQMNIRITAWCIDIRCWNLARCLIYLAKYVLGPHTKVSAYWVRQGASSPTLNFETPSLSQKLTELGSWNLAHWYAYAGTMTPCKTLSVRGVWGD